MKNILTSVIFTLVLGFCGAIVFLATQKHGLQPNYVLIADTIAVSGPCLNHDGAHIAMFLRDSRGYHGTISTRLARENQNVKIFLNKTDGRTYLSVENGNIFPDPPEGE